MSGFKTRHTSTILGVMAATAVCLTPVNAPKAQLFGESVTLAAALQLTGQLAATGRSYRDAYQFAVDTINEKGGVAVGSKKYQLDLTVLDSKSDPRLNVRLYERLLANTKRTFALGTYTSIEVLATSAIAEKYQVPMVVAGGASTQIFSRGNKYVFGTLPPAEDYFHSTIEMLKYLTPKAKTAGVISGNGAFDRAIAGNTITLLKDAGFSVIFNQEYSERTPNFGNLLTLFKSKPPDALLWSGHEPGAIAFIRAAKARRIGPHLFASFTVGVPSFNFRTTLREQADGIFGMTPWLPSKDYKDRWFGDASQFAAAFERKFGYAADYHVAAAVAAVEAQAFALEAAGSLDGKAVRDALARLDFESLYGRVRFGENGQVTMPQTVVQIQDGKLIEIFTDKFVNRPIYPITIRDSRS